MRVISYNILDGGKGRESQLGDVIESQRPEVVALAEANDANVIESLASRLKMDFITAPAAKGAVALLSHWPIRDSINHGAIRPHLEKGFLESTVIDPAGRQWIIAVLHFHAHALETDERVRELQLAEVLSALAPRRRNHTPHLLMGDFNSNSPVQEIDAAKLKKSTRQEYEQNGHHIPRRVIQRLLDEGYLDTLAAKHPRAAATVGSFSTESPGQRVDFIFAWGIEPHRIRDAWTIQNPTAKQASDHYPIGADLD